MDTRQSLLKMVPQIFYWDNAVFEPFCLRVGHKIDASA
jgi:hypothetical protein